MMVAGDANVRRMLLDHFPMLYDSLPCYTILELPTNLRPCFEWLSMRVPSQIHKSQLLLNNRECDRSGYE